MAKSATTLRDKNSTKYNAFWLSETKTEPDPDSIGRSEMRLIGQFPSRKEAEKTAIEFIRGTAGAVGFVLRKAPSQ